MDETQQGQQQEAAGVAGAGEEGAAAAEAGEEEAPEPAAAVAPRGGRRGRPRATPVSLLGCFPPVLPFSRLCCVRQGQRSGQGSQRAVRESPAPPRTRLLLQPKVDDTAAKAQAKRGKGKSATPFSAAAAAVAAAGGAEEEEAAAEQPTKRRARTAERQPAAEKKQSPEAKPTRKVWYGPTWLLAGCACNVCLVEAGCYWQLGLGAVAPTGGHLKSVHLVPPCSCR